ncbi:MAG: M20/M25/M40 family metallo-hydrolase [Blastocatellia bacterium]|nr:M20/M25/M40 family metallo-hydrolase [Blastocatellia bacterium]
MRILIVIVCLLLLIPTTIPKASDHVSQYQEAVSRIVGAALVDGKDYEKLAHLSDKIGARLSGSKQLEEAVNWTAEAMKADGLENVHTEKVMVPHWVRGQESGEIIAPVKKKLTMLGLGSTVGTSSEGLTGEVIEAKSFQELDKLSEKVKGKIVLYSFAMRSDVDPGQAYGEAVEFRTSGASRAAKYGAIGVLVRSVTTRSLNSPHTGNMIYDEGLPKIPGVAITTEDSDLISRLLAKGEKVSVKLTLGAKTLPDAESANVIGEIKGREKPDEIVLISGHLDSWDVGTGASDDGAGCVVAMEAARILMKLNLRPRRTIRVVLFTNEENGLRGARAYAEAHQADKHAAAIESDSGGAKPVGFSFAGTDEAFQIVEKIAPLLRGIETDKIVRRNGVGADISPLIRAGVPGFGLRQDVTHYFDIHHTDADTLDKIDRHHLALNTAAMTVMAYLLAEIPESLKK